MALAPSARRDGSPKPRPPRTSTRPATAPGSVAAVAHPVAVRVSRSPSPQRLGIIVNELDHRSIVALSHSCTEDVEQKQREKAALSQALLDLKKKKQQLDTKIARKRREVDSTVVQTMEMEKRLQTLSSSNKMVGAEVSGMRSENERLAAEVEQLRLQLKQANLNYERTAEECERFRQALQSCRKELAAEAKQRDTVQQDLRASRTAQTLMINRLDDMEKRNRALKTCVADTFNL